MTTFRIYAHRCPFTAAELDTLAAIIEVRRLAPRLLAKIRENVEQHRNDQEES